MMLLVFRISETQKIIRKNEKKFRSVFNEMKQMMFVLTPKAFVSESNSVSCVITGLDENITEDIYFYDLPIWKKTEGLPKLFKQAVQKCLSGENVHFETNLTNHLGFERTLDFTFFPIHDGSGEIFLIIISGYDISDLKETQKQLRDSIKKLKQTQTQLIISEKRAAFGQLAASLAHELNNPIAALKASFSNYKDIVTNNIMSFRSAGKVLSDKEMASCFELVELYSNNSVELSSREKRSLKNELTLSVKSKHPKQAEQIAKYLMSLKISDLSVIDFIIDNKNLLLILQLATGFVSMERNDKTILYSIKRTLNIVSSFKEYSSQDIKEFKEEIQPSQVILNVLNLLRPMIREELKFINRIEFDGTILISKDDIYQIFTHLIKNAIQANQSKGQIFISLISKEDNLIFSVKDQGTGISEEIADKIYEPFFTTKNEGEGAGLGLYIIKNLVKNNNGSLQFESNPDKGTTFELTLPLK
jgi:PAS domain S-box-containing protein